MDAKRDDLSELEERIDAEIESGADVDPIDRGPKKDPVAAVFLTRITYRGSGSVPTRDELDAAIENLLADDVSAGFGGTVSASSERVDR